MARGTGAWWVFPPAGGEPGGRARFLPGGRFAVIAASGNIELRSLAKTVWRPGGRGGAVADAGWRADDDRWSGAEGISFCAGRAGGILGNHARDQRMRSTAKLPQHLWSGSAEGWSDVCDRAGRCEIDRGPTGKGIFGQQPRAGRGDEPAER